MSKYNLKIGTNSETLYSVGQNIRKRREALKIQQKKFAELVRMDKSNYCKFESGKLNVSLLQFLEIVDTIQFFEKVNSEINKIL